MPGGSDCSRRGVEIVLSILLRTGRGTFSVISQNVAGTRRQSKPCLKPTGNGGKKLYPGCGSTRIYLVLRITATLNG
jgi:hypothetical protein